MMTEQPNQYMRLFKGHLKLDEATLTELFLTQLGNIYTAKSHLVTILPDLAATASFSELKNAILEGIGMIKMQILRMDVIFRDMGSVYDPEKSAGIKSITAEAYQACKPGSTTPVLIDMSIITHLRIIESIEIACFNMLGDIAVSFKNNDILTLLDQNLQSAINTKRMFELISLEYIS